MTWYLQKNKFKRHVQNVQEPGILNRLMDSDIFLTIIVFSLIALVNLLYAVRLITIVRGQRVIATIIGFIEAALFIYSLGRVADDFSQWHLVMAFSLGAAVGGDMGMLLERRLISGYVKVNIFVTQNGPFLAALIREQ